MPNPRAGESKEEYISRAIKYMVEKEGLAQKHAVAKAYGMWEQHKKNKRKTILHT
jgi:hypothetical protein